MLLLLLLWLRPSHQWLIYPGNRGVGFLLLNGIAKPSFVPCFLPVFPLAAFVRFGWSPELLRAALLTAGGVGLLALQYAYIYLAELGDRTLHDEPSGIAVDPFVAGIHFLAFWFSTVSYR